MIRQPDRTERAHPCAPLLACLALGLALLPATTAAYDPEVPATVEADRAEIDAEGGVSRYFGNVEMVQGELRITADSLVVTAPEGELERAEAEGEPARIFHRTADGDEVRARARALLYEPGYPRITLQGNAEIRHRGDRFSAGRIVYAPDSGRLEADRDDDERVRMTIDPGSADDDNGDE